MTITWADRRAERLAAKKEERVLKFRGPMRSPLAAGAGITTLEEADAAISALLGREYRTAT